MHSSTAFQLIELAVQCSELIELEPDVKTGIGISTKQHDKLA